MYDEIEDLKISVAKKNWLKGGGYHWSICYIKPVGPENMAHLLDFLTDILKHNGFIVKAEPADGKKDSF